MKLPEFNWAELTGHPVFMVRPLQTLKFQSYLKPLGYNGSKHHPEYSTGGYTCTNKGLPKLTFIYSSEVDIFWLEDFSC